MHIAAAASAAVASIPASATQSTSLFHKRRRFNNNNKNSSSLSFCCRAVAGNNNFGHFVQVVKKDVDFLKKNVTAGANWMSKVTRFPEVSKKVEEVVWLRNFEDPSYDTQKLGSPSWPQPCYPELSGTDLIMADIKAMEAYILYYYHLSKMWAKPLPEVYDAKEADDYFKCRPHVVALRLIEVFSAFASAALRIRVEGIRRSKNSTLGTEADEYNSQYNFGMVLKETMLNLGPTFIKVGQSLSTRPDIIGFPITKALSELHDQIPPFPRALAMKIIEEELGSPAETFFSHISEEAVAAASFGQVYRATTVDGRDVAVKVQRLNLRHVVFRDIYIMRVGLDILQQVTKRKSDLRLYADELGKGLVGELDYTLEAANAIEFMEAHSPFPSIRVPKVFQHLTQKRVLTMEWMAGENPKELLAKCNTSFENESQYSEKQRTDAKRHLLDLVNKGAEACLVQLIETGLLHADPHPGNMLYLPSGQIGFLDFGLICRMEKKHKYAMLGSIIHIVNGDWASLVGSLSEMDVVRPGTNIPLVTLELENAMDEVKFKDGIPDIRFNRVLGKVWAIAYKYNFRMPPYYTLLLRSLASFEEMNLFGVLRQGNPMELKEAIRPRRENEPSLLEATANLTIPLVLDPQQHSDMGDSTVQKSPLDFDNEDGDNPLLGADNTTIPPSTQEGINIINIEDEEAAEDDEGDVPLTHHSRRRKTVKRKKSSIPEDQGRAPAKRLREDHPEYQSNARDPPIVEEPSINTEGPSQVWEATPFTVVPPTSSELAQTSGNEETTREERTQQESQRIPSPAFEDVPPSPTPGHAAGTSEPGQVFYPGWKLTREDRLGTPASCREFIDHVTPTAYAADLHELSHEELIEEFNVAATHHIAIGAFLRKRFEESLQRLASAERRILRREKFVEEREEEIATLKKDLAATKATLVEQTQLAASRGVQVAVLEGTARTTSEKAAFAEARVQSLSSQVDALTHERDILQERIHGEEQLQAEFAAFMDTKERTYNEQLEEVNSRVDALSIDFDEELYPHMLTAIAGRRWMIGHGLRLAVMKVSESPEMVQPFANVVSDGIDRGSHEGLLAGMAWKRPVEEHDFYKPNAERDMIASMTALKDVSYPLLDQLEAKRDAPIDEVMALLHLNDTFGDQGAPEQWVNLQPSLHQLTIPIYADSPPSDDPWAIQGEKMLGDAIHANETRARGKRLDRVLCRTPTAGSAHLPRSDGVAVAAPTRTGLALVLDPSAPGPSDLATIGQQRRDLSSSIPPS